MLVRRVLFLFLILTFATVVGAKDAPFLMPVADTFVISGRGVVVAGTVERGSVKVNDTVEIVGLLPTKSATVSALEEKGKSLQQAGAGQTVGLILRGLSKDDVRRGQVLAQPGTLKSHSRATAKISMLSSQDGGRRTPAATGYRPQLRFRGVDFSATLELPEGQEHLQPGQSDVAVKVRLQEALAIEKGQSFEIREGGRTVGQGVLLTVGP